MTIKEKLQMCRSSGKALLATNFYNSDTLKAVLLAAQQTKIPLILQLTESSINYMGLKNAISFARTGLEAFEVEGWVHLDHGGSVELVKKCLDHGFDSVMIDGSELPFKENIVITQKVVKLASQYGANVEAELGYVAKLGQSKEIIGFTDPEEAKVFVNETGVDTLAVAIGTAHGFYKAEPKLDFERLETIAGLVDSPLVLHGSSGVPDEQVKKAILYGISKVNLATELKNTFMKKLKQILTLTDEIDLRKVFPEAIKEVQHLVEKKLRMVYLKNEK